MPLDCTLNETCYIQNYVDRDPGPGAADYTCGTLSYDGHKGTDFALPSLAAMRAGVEVLAAAPGTVTATRDGMPDTGLDGSDVEDRECGNGVLIRHGGGWETQYCHMKLDSIAVQIGQRVTKGTVLGQVGLSGKTQFPHVHLAVRHNGNVIDPFLTEPATCDATSPDPGLWQHPIDYRPGGLIAVGLSTDLPDYDTLKTTPPPTPSYLHADSPALVLWALGFGVQVGDVMTLHLLGPNGVVIDQEFTLDRAQAQVFRAYGHRGSDWPIGLYQGQIDLRRGDDLIDRRVLALTITR